MKTISKALAGTVAAGAMAMASITPAVARDRDDKIDAGEIIAGAVILGGIAAILSSGSRDRDRYDRDYYRADRNRGNPRVAIDRCVQAAESTARRYGGYRYADVTDIRDVDRTNRGWRVKGRIAVDGARGYRDRYDRRGADDRGNFTCRIDRGRVVDVNFGGIRGLR
ncbi:hypothetical protein [Qipengyuania sp. JC766]|uniref:hypothetical protein n=1 Tax=Qipengyuania sp. JC766 TaxID=3232139 RepID=UPI003459AB73